MAANKYIFILIFVFSYSLVSFSQGFIVESIAVEGNTRTKTNFILRELPFVEGDTILLSNWDKIKKQSVNNLINTSLFHEAIITLNGEGNYKQIAIKVVERWYLWPIPQFSIEERNFNVWWETKDLSRASIGMFLTHNNMRGRGEIMKLLVMFGYNKKLGFSYEMPYINKKKTFGLGLQSIYTTRHEVNMQTEYDKQVYLKTENEVIQEDWLTSFQFTYRPKIHIHNLLQLKYHQWYFADTLLETNNNYSSNMDANLKYFGIYYKLKIDFRDYKPYPLDGFYIDFEVLKNGLGVFENDLNMLSFKSTMRKYIKISSRFYYAVGFIGKMSSSAYQPYLLERGLGYGRDFVRGYEYYVVDGQNYIVGKNNIKYAVIPKRTIKMNWIPTDKFNKIPYSIFINVFSDAGIVNNSQFYSSTNYLPNRFLFSGGIGLDFVTYYDAVARIEWTVNKLGESHFYLHFIAPI
jgi:outer membrane protein assembly factor BamA